MPDAGLGSVGERWSVAVEGAEAEAPLRSLQEWLAWDDRLRGRVDWLRRPPQPGHMGAVLDTLTVILGTGGVAALITPLCTWLTNRRPDVSLTVELPNGRMVSVDVKRAHDERAVIREIQGLLDPTDERDA
ncbi:hypothetical protein ACFVFQ_04810 [Streptomyces sp. NPDC057743]|uniref:effector-associated constant component EACC1 n=1 Tax=Streptomyces sp. NPDC057743 TaxID=3346236 RepID=UPI003695CB90